MDQKTNQIKNLLTIALVLLLLLSVLFVGRGYFAGHFHSVESFRAYVGTFGVLAPLILTVIQAIQVILPVVPGFLGCIVGAGMFGAAGGFWCNYIGISAGSIIAFFLARRFGVELVGRMVPMEKYKSWTTWMNRTNLYSLVLFLAILLPLTPDDFLCYFSGLTAMSSKRFIWMILVGKPWCILAYCIFFAHLI